MPRISRLLAVAVMLGLFHTATARQATAGGNSCDSGGCQNCEDDWMGHDCLWYTGVEATFLKLFPTQNRVLFEDDNDDAFRYSILEGAPRVWFGVQHCNGCGIRGRYWNYDADAQFREIEELDFDDEEIEATFTASEFELYNVDLELTKRCSCDCWELLFSGGVRYASIGHRYVGNLIEFEDDDGDTDFFALSRRMNGAGVTAGAEVWRFLGDSDVALFGSARASVVWGNNHAQALLIAIEDDDLDGDEFAGETRDRDMMSIFEAQVGLQWSRPIKCMGDAEVFVRGAFEYQHWRLTRQNGLQEFVGNPGDDPLRVDALGRGNVNLYGVAFSAGITR